MDRELKIFLLGKESNNDGTFFNERVCKREWSSISCKQKTVVKVDRGKGNGFLIIEAFKNFSERTFSWRSKTES